MHVSEEMLKSLPHMLQVLVFELQVYPFHFQIIDSFLSSLWTHAFKYENINLVQDLLNPEVIAIWICCHQILINYLKFLQ